MIVHRGAISSNEACTSSEDLFTVCFAPLAVSNATGTPSRSIRGARSKDIVRLDICASPVTPSPHRWDCANLVFIDIATRHCSTVLCWPAPEAPLLFRQTLPGQHRHAAHRILCQR